MVQPRGTLKVSLPVDFATTYLAPLLPEFAALYPDISFDLDLTPRNVDLIAEPFDLAIRMAAPEAGSLVSRVVGRLTAQLFASPGYLATRGEPRHPAELERHDCLTMQNRRTWTLHRGAEASEVGASSRFMANSVALLRRLAVQDLGIVFMPARAIEDELASGRLRKILPDWRGAPQAIHAVTTTRLLPARTQRFIEFLRGKLTADAE